MRNQPSESEDFGERIGNLLGRLQNDAEKRGWKFFVRPSGELIPEFLKGYRPDALAIGPDGGVVIEIKRQHETKQERLVAIADLVEAQKGWTFRLFYVSPTIEHRSDSPAPMELAAGIAEARTLLESGHVRAALVIAWSILEAVARLVTPEREKTSAQSLSPIQAVQMLAGMGYLEEVEARRLRDLTHLRNAVVHGDLRIAIPASEVAQLIGDLEVISGNLDQAA